LENGKTCVGCATPLKLRVAFNAKFDPETVIVMGKRLPAIRLLGEMESSVGTG